MMSGAFTTLRDEVLGTQNVLGATIQEAKVALNVMHDGFSSRPFPPAPPSSATPWRR